MKTYRAAVIGCSRMGGFIDNEVAKSGTIVLPYSHAAGYVACVRTELWLFGPGSWMRDMMVISPMPT